MADMMRALMVMKKDEMDDDYELECRLFPRFDIPYSVLRLEDDNYYGSDFIRMAAILQETEKYKPPGTPHPSLKALSGHFFMCFRKFSHNWL